MSEQEIEEAEEAFIQGEQDWLDRQEELKRTRRSG
jgi:hypothetical protein